MRRNLLRLVILALALVCFANVYGQKSNARVRAIKASPAYCALVLEKVKAEAEAFAMRQRFSPGWRGYKEKQYKVAALEREMRRMRGWPASRAASLTEAYAKLLLHKVELEGQVITMRETFGPEWPERKTKEYELAVMRRELRELLR
jgi:hypothetical protein